MPSLIPGYEYDIFISYRQKDNKHDGWVTEFVDNLKGELESTFKEEINVYFDINPHNGLLDTHDVDASLKEKLKCLIFIPVISRTYGDPKSFAWEHEFKAFIEQASKDQFGLKVKLPDANVAGRVLPVRIHNLDPEDIKLCESLLGGPLRGVEFIYRELGVNRPMTMLDNEEKNLNGTRYRNQINRVANAIKDIISGLRSEPVESRSLSSRVLSSFEEPGIQKKSIIVLPFENISSDPGQEYFSDGLTEEVISDLSHVPDLLVISRRSAMVFRERRNTIREIAEKVNVRYVLEGSVRKEMNNLRITAQLIDSLNDSHIWSEKYSGTLEDVFDIQEKVSKSIVSALKIRLSSKDNRKIHQRPIDNVFAYDCYKKAYPEIISFNKHRIELGLKLLQKGIDIEGDNALIFAGMAFAYFQLVNAGADRGMNLKYSEEYVNKAFSLNNELAEAHFVMAFISSLTGEGEKGMEHILRAHAAKPEDPEIMLWLAEAYTLIGRMEEGMTFIKRCIKIDPLNPMTESITGWNYFYGGKFDLAQDSFLSAYNSTPQSRMNQFWKALILFYMGRADDSLEFINNCIEEPPVDSWTQMTVFLKYIIKGEKNKLKKLLTPEFNKIHWFDPQNSYLIAACYSYIDEKDKSFKWLEHAVERGIINYPFINEYDPLLKNIRSEERFGILMDKVKDRWESFEVYCKFNKLKES